MFQKLQKQLVLLHQLFLFCMLWKLQKEQSNHNYKNLVTNLSYADNLSHSLVTEITQTGFVNTDHVGKGPTFSFIIDSRQGNYLIRVNIDIVSPYRNKKYRIERV